MKNKNDIKFQNETLELFIKTITKMMQKVVKDELKSFEKHYTQEVLDPIIEDLEARINSATTVSE